MLLSDICLTSDVCHAHLE